MSEHQETLEGRLKEPMLYEPSPEGRVRCHLCAHGCVIVTNGYMTERMLAAFHPYLDAANVDLKAFRDETYRKYVGGGLQPILDNLERLKQLGVWVEVTMLIVPGLNDGGLLQLFQRHVAGDVQGNLGPVLVIPDHRRQIVPSQRPRRRFPSLSMPVAATSGKPTTSSLPHKDRAVWLSQFRPNLGRGVAVPRERYDQYMQRQHYKHVGLDYGSRWISEGFPMRHA